jgi:diaminohydroxyphosphoribosylaminopyrimidine deaminase/5-amino-6-(5-phosphoribosylamino)uracil reductase
LSELTEDDIRWLDAAARMASPLLGTTAENPTVGALVVDSRGRALQGRGVTAPGGRPHAEPQALEQAGIFAEGGTLYVTLEPCFHTGRTPPCVDAISRAKIARVVCGAVDPDPRTAGQGIERLKQAGIEVHVAPRHLPSFRLHEGHFSRLLRSRPLVVTKLAVSADGRVGRRDKGNVPITNSESKRWTHMLRAGVDAIMVGAETARLDDPLLTVRLAGLESRRPVRIVLAGVRDLPQDLKIFSSPEAGESWVLTDRGSDLEVPEGVKTLSFGGETPKQKLRAALQVLAGRGIGRLLVEGGAALTESLLAAGVVDRFHLLLGREVIGSHGVRATPLGTIVERLLDAGFKLVDQRDLAGDSLRTFERNI